MSFVDKTLTCVDCGQSFTFTAGEQEFHQSKGFTSEPRRCASCRASRKGAGVSRSRESRDMFTVACASCGNPARVPFEPREGRPVYCSDCFQPQPRNVANSFARTGTRYGAFRTGYGNSHGERSAAYDRSPRGKRPQRNTRSW